MNRGALDNFRASTGFGMGNVQNEDTRRRNDMYSTFGGNAYNKQSDFKQNSGAGNSGANDVGSPAGPVMPAFAANRPPAWQQQMYRTSFGRPYYGPGAAQGGTQQPPQNVWGSSNVPSWAQNVQQYYSNMRDPRNWRSYNRTNLGVGGPIASGGGVEPIDPVPTQY